MRSDMRPNRESCIEKHVLIKYFDAKSLDFHGSFVGGIPTIDSTSRIRLCIYSNLVFAVYVSLWRTSIYLWKFSYSLSCLRLCLCISCCTLYSSLSKVFFAFTIFICWTAPAVSFSALMISSWRLWYLISETTSINTASKLSSYPLNVIASLLARPGTLCWFLGDAPADTSTELMWGTELMVPNSRTELF